MFPEGAAGLGLLILRVCADGALFAGAYLHGEFRVAGWAEAGVTAILILIGMGILTPIACGLCALLEVFYLINGHGTEAWLIAFALMITLSLGLLGPGAFSIDARLFGRRLIVPGKD